MKNITRITAGLLAIIMILALATTAFADGDDNNTTEFTISVADDDTHVYAIYQIFTGDFYDGTLSNIELGDNAKSGTDKAKALAELTTLADNATDAAKLEVITKYVDMESAPVTVFYGNDATVPAGYYLIKDAVASTSGGDPNTVYIVKVADNIEISRKADPATLDKKIVEGTAEKTVNSANIGDTVSFKLTATLPEQCNGYNTFYLSFQDKLSAGLTLDASTIAVKHGTTQLENDKYYIYGSRNEFQVVIYDLKTAVPAAQPGDTIVLTYDATVNENAVITEAGNTNVAKLVYTVDPSVTTVPAPGANDKPGTPDKPEVPNVTPPSVSDGFEPTTDKTTKTVVFGLQINKKDGEGHSLTGAEFTLTPAETYVINKVIVTDTRFEEIPDGTTIPDGTAVYWKLKDNKGYTTKDPTGLTDATKALYESTTQKYKQVEYAAADRVIEAAPDQEVKAFVGADGVAKFSGLKAGTYTLTETNTPAGYITAAPITITFTVNADGTVSATQGTGTDAKVLSRVSTTEPSFSLDVINVAGVILPTTGGIGTTIFYVLGAVMVLGAGVLLITKKRMGM